MTLLQKTFGVCAALIAAAGLAGCGDLGKSYQELQAEKQEEAMEAIRTSGIDIEKINLPKEFYDLNKGFYELKKFKTPNGERDCIANVVQTTHSYKNVILTCN